MWSVVFYPILSHSSSLCLCLKVFLISVFQHKFSGRTCDSCRCDREHKMLSECVSERQQVSLYMFGDFAAKKYPISALPHPVHFTAIERSHADAAPPSRRRRIGRPQEQTYGMARRRRPAEAVAAIPRHAAQPTPRRCPRRRRRTAHRDRTGRGREGEVSLPSLAAAAADVRSANGRAACHCHTTTRIV